MVVPWDDVHRVHKLIELMVNDNHVSLLDQPKLIRGNVKKGKDRE